MKHLKLFNLFKKKSTPVDNTIISYQEISETEYMHMADNCITEEISKEEFRQLPHNKNLRINKEHFKKLDDDISYVYTGEMSLQPYPDNNKRTLLFSIRKFQDEWYIVDINGLLATGQRIKRLRITYKCDQLIGFIQCIDHLYNTYNDIDKPSHGQKYTHLDL